MSALLVMLICAAAVPAAEWPATRPAAEHWSFVKPQRPPIPPVRNQAWCRNSIDRFVLAELESRGIAPAPEAPRVTLLRRVSLDLIGLQPTPGEIDAFLADPSPDAYEKVVDRLLASPHYGERWGKHWLDAARYADSNGYSQDNPRSIWKYRDWVIDATNRDMPFDTFTIEQIAGDLLPNATLDQKIATGFHRNTQINQEGGIDPEQFRVESIIDRVNTTGTVFLGLTIGCAQCHNHKFDPISQKDYYSFYSFFNQCDEPELKTPTPEETAHDAELRQKLAALDAERAAAAAKAAAGAKIDDAVRELDSRRKKLRAKEATAITTTMVMAQRPVPRESFIFIKGDFTRHGDAVSPAVPAILPQIQAAHPTRLDLARWIVDPANPLTARVTVNRIWQHYFGLGIVDTENDFGTQGSLPSNSRLLDWLATEFIQRHWSRKAIHRLIVTSAAYRQSSTFRPELADADPYNRLLARQSRIRVDAEIVRDIGLEASGLLCQTVGGPSVFPPQPDGVMSLGQVAHVWKTSTGPDRYRRGLYTFFFRASPHPLLTSFDANNATATCTRRLRSNTPLQALILLNDQASLEFAKAMAARILHDCQGDDAARIAYAFRLAASRQPAADETDVLLQVLKKQRDAFAADPKSAEPLAWKEAPAGMEATTLAAWTIVSRVILNLDETITRE